MACYVLPDWFNLNVRIEDSRENSGRGSIENAGNLTVSYGGHSIGLFQHCGPNSFGQRDCMPLNMRKVEVGILIDIPLGITLFDFLRAATS